MKRSAANSFNAITVDSDQSTNDMVSIFSTRKIKIGHNRGISDPVIQKFETALKLNKNHLGLNFALLEIYLKVPRFLGGGKKKAFTIVNNIDSISKKEGDLAKKMYDDF